MPPKTAKESKAEKNNAQAEPPATPTKQKSKPVQRTPKDTARKKNDEGVTLNFRPLRFNTTSCEMTAPVEVSLDDDSNHAKQNKKGDYMKLIKLSAPINFEVVKTSMVEEGENQGCQVVYIKPAKAFEFGKLPKEVRIRMYRYYFACKGLVDEPIEFDGKRTASKEVFAKTYADGSKNRVSLLATNKEIYKEAMSVFYSKTFRLENTENLIDFLSQVVEARPRLRSIEVKAFNKATARPAMQFLAEARHIKRLHFESGVSNEADPKKAAKVFYDQAHRFLKAVNGGKTNDAVEESGSGPEATGVDVLSFAKTAFAYQDDKKQTKYWDDAMVKEFKEHLKSKML